MDYYIRLAEKGDASKLNIFWNNALNYYSNLKDLENDDDGKSQVDSENHSINSLIKKIENTNNFIYILENNGSILTTISFFKNKSESNFMSAFDFQTLPDYFGKGFGKKLLEKAIFDIVNMSYDFIEITLSAKNERTIKYLNKFGFFRDSNSIKNYLPLIYKTTEGRNFFRKNNLFETFNSLISGREDSDNKVSKIFNYVWEKNNEKLFVKIDSEKNVVLEIIYTESKSSENTKNIQKTFNFEKFTGKNVKIGIIDSGIDQSHPDVKAVDGGINIFFDENKNIVKDDDYGDKVGHGTACAGIIRKKSNDAKIYSIKVFQDESLCCTLDVLIEGIIWAIEAGMNVVNLSLGAVGEKNVSRLLDVCEYAKSKNVVIVASDDNDNVMSYPSVFLNVIGVTGAKITGAYNYHYSNKLLTPFLARGDRQRLAWIDKGYIFMGGTSFATPHITAICALILESNPKLSFDELFSELANLSNKSEVEVFKDKLLYLEQKQKIGDENKSGNDIKNKFVSKDFKWIKRACIYPFNKEMHALVRGKELLDFEITSIVDPIGKGLVGKDAGECIGVEKIGIVVESNLKNALEKADTLILSHIKELSRLTRKDLFKESFEKAIEMKKNIYFLDSLNYDDYNDLINLAKQNGLIVDFPKIENIDFNDAYYKRNERIKIPVVGVFGTSSQQGKFSLQLALRKRLLKEGYKIAQIGTEPHSELFGIDLTFPNGYDSIVNFDEKQIILFLHYNILNIIEEKNPDILIVGNQSGFIPKNINNFENTNIESIPFLYGTKPDAYIICVNTIDEYKHIKDTITALEVLGKGKTILLALSDQEKVVKNLYGKVFIQNRKIDKNELKNKIKEIEAEFNIPTTDIASPEGEEKIFNTVIKFFSQN